jgi:hypothetical protein
MQLMHKFSLTPEFGCGNISVLDSVIHATCEAHAKFDKDDLQTSNPQDSTKWIYKTQYVKLIRNVINYGLMLL